MKMTKLCKSKIALLLLLFLIMTINRVSAADATTAATSTTASTPVVDEKSSSQSDEAAVKSCVTSIRERYADITTLTASFIQESYQAIMQEIQLEKGTITIQKPDHMLWSYDEPVVKKVILDGTYVWLYTLNDNHLYRERYDSYSQNLFYQLISGTINLNESFTLALVKPDDSAEQKKTTENQMMLKLTPRQTHPSIASITVAIGEKTNLITRTIVTDHYGNATTCHFSQFSLNPQLPAKTFTIHVNEDVTLTDYAGTLLDSSVLNDSATIIRQSTKSP